MSDAKTIKHGDFPARLRELRRQRNLSQAELGVLTGLHPTHLGRYERGQARPTADTLTKLSAALNVSSDFLLDGVADEAARARFEDRDLLRQFQEVQTLPDKQKDVVKELLDAFLTKQQLKALAAR